MDINSKLGKYDYRLPKELIAQAPATPRDRARLFVYDRKARKVVFDRFANLAEHLPRNAVLVFNETKVLPARFVVKRATSGRVKLLYLASVGKNIEALSERRLLAGEKLYVSGKVFFTVIKKTGSVYTLRAPFDRSTLVDYLIRRGEAPIPPYLRHTVLSGAKLRRAYQTVFAKSPGSAAAPTASLHFTKGLMKKLRAAGFATKFVSLHVGLGTFAPLTATNLRRGKLHSEPYAIDKKTAAFLNRVKSEGRPIVAVGTTVVRTLESAASAGRLKKIHGSTRLFIRAGDKIKFVDCLITNFHVPRSSLMMLVSALTGRKKLLALYRLAVKNRFRFFSFGDGMLVR
ncbi:MAG: tRNA preQ1(34) S-adenosylmethionine ribosyltransferase-isomerase QueA [Patescibacteria group bacterium]|nr:tRNA preQ1(34) S-adenosylmethionine ribosyltransferase-isomerase QueA [Patescibacteria group bacterium]